MNLTATIHDHPDDAVAVISRGRTTTYGELRAQVARLAGGLRSLGLETGDRVGIVAGTNWYFTVSYLAVLHAGLVAVPLNPTDPPPAIRRELGAVGARGLVVSPTGRAVLLDGSVESLPTLDHVVVTEGADRESRALLDDLLAHDPIEAVEVDDADLATLIFTSGTAGAPKAAMLTHGNLRSNLEQLEAQPGREIGPSDVVLGVLPLFHIFGLNVALMGALRAGATILLIERFDPVSALEAIARHGVTVVSGAPTMWAAWAQLPDLPPDGFATVRLAASGAAKLDPSISTTMRERFGLVVGEGYGLTEASPVVTSSAGMEVKLGSIGAPVP
ncbi:MAG TPA: long-chain fatty acid--CoA ligase, partial [Acidimicrobiales bacterium]